MENQNNKKVEVHSVLTVVSSAPVTPQNRIITLSPLDHAMGSHFVYIIFYFRSSKLNFDRIRPALNEVLTMYPNVTGRLVKDGDDNWIIRCTDAGLRVYHAKVGVTVDEWFRFACADDEKHLTVLEDFPHDHDHTLYWSPFRMQVTDFEGGGTAISLSCPHMLGDPISMTLFIKSWAEAYHHEVIVHPPFLNAHALRVPPTFATRTITTSPSQYASKSTTSYLNNPKSKMVSATFNFTNKTMKHHVTKICSTLPNATPFDLLTAVFWTTIAQVKANNLKQSISICMDMRKRLHAPLPYGYFGNALHFSKLTVNADKMESGDLGQVAELVHYHVAGLKEEEFWCAIDWLKSRKDDQGKFLPPFRMYGPDLTCVNMENMITPIGTHVTASQPLMYGVEFVKDQKPAHVSYHVENSEGEGLILVMPSPEEGLARRVTVTLPEAEMEKLLQNEVILSLDPTMLLLR
ncbi:Protein ECERIFERUM 2 [Bienertia sinuspersici]